jgi:hypothetical protein
MDYIAEIAKLRNDMHKEIILTMIRDNKDYDDYQLAFKRPIDCTVKYFRPTQHNGVEDVIIIGIDGTSNELLSVNEDGEDRYIFYYDLSLEDLALVHRSVITQDYITKELVVC